MLCPAYESGVRQVTSAGAALLCFFAAVTASLNSDGVALLEFKSAVTAHPAHAFSTWNASGDTPCAWKGIACSLQGGQLRVTSLNMANKNLSGTLSGGAIASLVHLRRLSLHHNNLSGPIPPSLFTPSSSLRSIFLHRNLFLGSIPPQLSLLHRTLQALDLSHNLLSGSIPPAIARCKKLQRLILAHNSLSYFIPDSLGSELRFLQELDLSANTLSGPIPRVFGNLTSLQRTLNLSYNMLSGSIPESLGNLPYTVALDVSHNNLSGEIPQEGSLLDQGPGPFMGNPALCGLPLRRPCPHVPLIPPIPSLPADGGGPSDIDGPFGVHPAGGHFRGRASLPTGAIVAITVGDAAAIALLGLIVVYFYWKASTWEDDMSCCARLCKKGSSSSSSKGDSAAEKGSSSEASSGRKSSEKGELVALDKAFCYDLDELLRASAYVLGKGGLGIVYKVVLGDGTSVAVRRLGDGGQGLKDFVPEVEAVARVRHPNLVRMRAYYWAEDEKLLIYDYIPHGSLAAALHGQSQPLSWRERLSIAEGTAAALAYLHDCKCAHGSLRASNVLLDMHMQAYVADFGLARLATVAGIPAPAPAPSTPGGRATPSPGAIYRAPEAAHDKKPTQKSDVYAFGIILLELLTGRSPAAHAASFGEDLAAWVGRSFREENALTHILDACLVWETAHAQKDAAQAFDVALSCTCPQPAQRPKMKLVLHSLNKISSPVTQSTKL